MKTIKDYPAPTTLEEAVKTLVKTTSKKEKEDIKATPHDDVMGQLHHGFGTFVRNEWKLWDDQTPLVQSVYAKYGVKFGDDVSGLILNAYIAKLQGTEFDLEAEAARYRDHWEEIGEQLNTLDKKPGLIERIWVKATSIFR